MAPRTRLISPVPTRLMPAARLPGAQGLFLAALLTLFALVPFGAVLGYVVAGKLGHEPTPFAALGGLLGALFALWKWKR